MRRASQGFAAELAFASVAVVGAHAQDAYPSRPIKLIVPFAAGGNTDAVGRVAAFHLSEKGDALVFYRGQYRDL